MKPYQKLLLIFLLAFILRLLAWSYFPSYHSITQYTDEIEYYNNSIDLTVDKYYGAMWNYTEWYQRTPLYVLFLHFTYRQIIIQILISAFACVVMYKMNWLAGLIWCFYPQDIFCSINYAKEGLLIPLVIFAIYLLRDNKWWLIIVIPLLISGFVSYGGVIATDAKMGQNLTLNIYHLWQPPYNYTWLYSKVLVHLEFLPYTLMMCIWIRHMDLKFVNFWSFIKRNQELPLVIILSLGYCWSYAEPRYKEPFMPLLVLFFGNYINNRKLKAVKKKKNNI